MGNKKTAWNQPQGIYAGKKHIMAAVSGGLIQAGHPHKRKKNIWADKKTW